jgi:hypothetical protein
MDELKGVNAGLEGWYRKINTGLLSGAMRRLILKRIEKKSRFTKALEALDTSKGSLHNYIYVSPTSSRPA